MVCDIEKIKGKRNIGRREVSNITNVPKRFISEKIKINSLNLNRVNFYQKMLKTIEFLTVFSIVFQNCKVRIEYILKNFNGWADILTSSFLNVMFY